MTLPDLTVAATGLARWYGALPAVRDLTLNLARGEVLGLLGPNGAGKSTTLQMITGNLAPSAGTVSICGADLAEQPREAKARLGYLPETPPLYRDFTVDEYLRLAARLHRVPRPRLAAAVAAARERCGLADSGRKLIGTLSKGYQQRVGIAQAIVHEPEVVVLDEPTVGLDPIQIREIRALVRELGREKSVILSTHILPEVQSVCDRVHIISKGAVVYQGSIEGLSAQAGGGSLQVGFRQPPPAAALRALTGVTAVDEQGGGRFRLLHEAGRDPSEDLVRLSVEGGWRLHMLAPEQASLEEVFVQLTRQEEAP